MQPTSTISAPRTVSLQQARREVGQQRRQRYRAFREFKTSYHDLFDGHDWNHYVSATGLQLATLLRYRQLHPEAPRRLFARSPGQQWFDPLCVRTGQWVECDFEATKATDQLLRFLASQHPGWEFRAARSGHEANAA